jgi:hypothetical protein
MPFVQCYYCHGQGTVFDVIADRFRQCRLCKGSKVLPVMVKDLSPKPNKHEAKPRSDPDGISRPE